MSILFDETKIVWINENLDWKQIIYKGVEMLVESQAANWELYDAILESTQKYGAYYVFDPGIALVHAPVGPYCLKVATSAIILQEPVIFNSQPDKKAKIIITLATPNANDQIEVIQEFGRYFMDAQMQTKFMAVKNLSEFLNLIKENH